ncbi:hypothetical protein DEU52_116120, partial [Ensifer adhaerens]
PHVEIELSPERAAAGDHSRIAFRPTKWKIFREEQPNAAATLEAPAEVETAEPFELARTGS